MTIVKAKSTWMLAGLFALATATVACAGTIGQEGHAGDENNGGGGGNDNGDNGDSDVEVPRPVSGMALNWADDTPIPGAMIEIPELEFSGLSAADGSFATTPFLSGKVFSLSTTATNYRATINPKHITVEEAISVNAFVVSSGEDLRQTTAAGVTRVVGASVIVAELLDTDGSPRIDVPLINIGLVNRDDQPVGDGPFFLGADSLVDLGIELSSAVDGKARAIFLNVPNGMLKLSVSYPNPADPAAPGEPMIHELMMTTNSAALVRVNDKAIIDNAIDNN